MTEQAPQRHEGPASPEGLLAGQVAVVTGGNKGLGAEILREFARNGVRKTFVLSRTPADDIALEVAPYGMEVVHIPTDMANEDDIVRAVKTIKDHGDQVDVLVNNAAITGDGHFEYSKRAVVENVMDVNVIAPFMLTKHVVSNDMFPEEGASVINMSSILGFEGNELSDKYAASKAALIGMTKSLSKSLGDRNIRVNAVAPGFIGETDMTKDMGPVVEQVIVDLTPLGRLGKPQDVAPFVAFLASSKMSFATGGVFVIDGGIGGRASSAIPLLEGGYVKLSDQEQEIIDAHRAQ